MRMTEWELRPAKSYRGNGLLEQMVSGGGLEATQVAASP